MKRYLLLSLLAVSCGSHHKSKSSPPEAVVTIEGESGAEALPLGEASSTDLSEAFGEEIFGAPPSRVSLWYCKSSDLKARVFVEEYINFSRRYTVFLKLQEGITESFKAEEAPFSDEFISPEGDYPLSSNVLHGMLESTRLSYGLGPEANLLLTLGRSAGAVTMSVSATADGVNPISLGLEPLVCAKIGN